MKTAFKHVLSALLMAGVAHASAWAQTTSSATASVTDPIPGPTPAPVSAPAATAGQAASHQHPLLSRQSHLKRLDERIHIPAEELRSQCRFQSDIATPPAPGRVVLTFDDGPDPEHTEQILAVLDRFQLDATFFFIGEKMVRHPDLVQKVLEKRRHTIGSHSWSHPNFHEVDEQEQRSEIDRGLAVMPVQAGTPLFRYPYGNSSCASNEQLKQLGRRIVGWHVDSCDWAFDKTGSVDTHEALSCGVLSQYRHDFVGHVTASLRARRGGIVLLHETHPNTLAKLQQLIEDIRKEGFVFTRLDDPAFSASLR